jgi:hypothetical protein
LAVEICHIDVNLFGVEQAIVKKELKMKTLRILTLALIAVLVISAWAPSPAYAMSGQTDATANPAKSQFATLIVNNRTGGTVYVKLSGSTSYWFSALKQGKTVFSNIKPGKYTVVLTASACQGSLKYKINMKAGSRFTMPVACR